MEERTPLLLRLYDNRHLLGALVALVVLSNIPNGHYILYPFQLFTTWIHEICHGLAAFATGGSFNEIRLFSDTSGQAINDVMQGSTNKIIVASAGYLGTSLFGALLIFLQRPTSFSRVLAGLAVVGMGALVFTSVRPWEGIALFSAFILVVVTLAFLTPKEEVGRVGSICLGCLLLLTLFFARTPFTIISLSLLGALFLSIGIKASLAVSRFTFSFVAAVLGLNALTSIRALFASQLVVDGKKVGLSDAHVVAEELFGPYQLWAILWLLLSIFLLGWALIRMLSTSRPAPPPTKEEPLSEAKSKPPLPETATK